MARHFMDFAFSDSVRSEQERFGTRSAYERMETKEAFRNQLTWQENSFIKGRDSFYVASAGENGWPYLQHRGGPKGFLKVIGDNQLAFADFKGNGQYISVGNFRANRKSVLFFMDYPRQQRLKIWAETDVLYPAEEPGLMEQVVLPDYGAQVERIIVFKVLAFDWNCPQHISPRYTREEIKNAVFPMDEELIPLT